MKKIKVLIVEDSLMFRQILVRNFITDPMLEVVAQASDPYEARDAILKYEPDVMTLDIELPRMDGIEFLRKLMPQYPLPTVVISALSDRVFDAMSAGAVEFVNKPSGMTAEQIAEFIRGELITKIKIASTVQVGKLKRVGSHSFRQNGYGTGAGTVVAIGASTGGTEALYEVVRRFHQDIPGTVIVQHMPPGFTQMYAERLDRICQMKVKEAENGDEIVRGQALIAPGDKQMRVVRNGTRYTVSCMPGEKVSGHCPSVDALFLSMAQNVRCRMVGIIMTGMGSDGAKGLLEMRKKGAYTIGQDKDSCVVYGMPMVAHNIGAVMQQASCENIAGVLVRHLGGSHL